ncbi:hypothetical protein JHK82_042925 [Glycine max]|nr:hypothetical protein JHK86_042941 [Glycine max]KAG5105955.1 hypothetical protein JHK82_042925 [Glycine max]
MKEQLATFRSQLEDFARKHNLKKVRARKQERGCIVRDVMRGEERKMGIRDSKKCALAFKVPRRAYTSNVVETGCGVKETKKWASTSNCSGHAEESIALDIAKKGSNGWIQFKEREAAYKF